MTSVLCKKLSLLQAEIHYDHTYFDMRTLKKNEEANVQAPMSLEPTSGEARRLEAPSPDQNVPYIQSVFPMRVRIGSTSRSQ